MEPHRPTPRLSTPHRPSLRSHPRLRRLLIVAAIVAAMGVVTLLEVAVCPMAVIVGIPCPGCGMTRATLSALHGDFATSFRFHPLGMIIVPLFATYAIAHAVSYIRHGVSQVDKIVSGKWIDRFLVLLLITMIGVWIARFFGAFGGPAPV
ncbi:MAG: DUF2752 domain-containing protein [Myxococcota bacterium]